MLFELSSCLLLTAAFCGIYRGNEHFLEFCIKGENFLVIQIAALGKKLQPIFTFGALFERDLEPGNKIGFAMGILGLTDIGSYTCAGAQQLICKHGFPVLTFYPAANPKIRMRRYGE